MLPIDFWQRRHVPAVYTERQQQMSVSRSHGLIAGSGSQPETNRCSEMIFADTHGSNVQSSCLSLRYAVGQSRDTESGRQVTRERQCPAPVEKQKKCQVGPFIWTWHKVAKKKLWVNIAVLQLCPPSVSVPLSLSHLQVLSRNKVERVVFSLLRVLVLSFVILYNKKTEKIVVDRLVSVFHKYPTTHQAGFDVRLFYCWVGAFDFPFFVGVRPRREAINSVLPSRDWLVRSLPSTSAFRYIWRIYS